MTRIPEGAGAYNVAIAFALENGVTSYIYVDYRGTLAEFLHALAGMKRVVSVNETRAKEEPQ
jgi:hypothetical protein